MSAAPLTPRPTLGHRSGEAQRAAARPQETSSGMGLTALLLGVLAVPCAIAYAMATSNELPVLAVVLGILATGLILARPFVGLVVFTGLLYTRPEEAIKPLAGLHLTLVIAVVTLVGVLLQMVINREPLVKTPQLWMMAGFCLTGIASSFLSGTFGAAIQDFSRFFILVFLISNLVRTGERFDRLVWAIIAFTLYLAIYSIVLYQGGTAANDRGLARSVSTGIFSDPNDLASVLVAGYGLCVVNIWRGRGWARLVYGGVVMVLLVAIFYTSSRGGFLALLFSTGLITFLANRQKPWAVVLAGVLCLAILAGGKGSHITNYDSNEESANSRFHFWDNGFNQLASNPVLGIGYGAFPDTNGGYTAHNTWVLCFSEMGLTGFFFFMGVMYYCFRPARTGDGALAAAQAGEDPQYATRILAARMCLAGNLAACFWISRTYSPITYVLLALPVVAQMTSPAFQGHPVWKIEVKEQWREYGKIAVAGGLALFVIRMLALKLQ